MSKSHTKHPIGCSHYRKKGYSKKGKIYANRYFRRTFINLKIEHLYKGNFHKKIIPWWEIKGDFGNSRYEMSEFINDWIDYYGNYKKTLLVWKKNYYFK